MNGVFTHTRDIYCMLSRNLLVYRIPIYFAPELDYLKTPFLQIEIDTRKQKEVVFYKENELKTFLEVRNIQMEMGCCERK